MIRRAFQILCILSLLLLLLLLISISALWLRSYRAWDQLRHIGFIDSQKAVVWYRLHSLRGKMVFDRNSEAGLDNYEEYKASIQRARNIRPVWITDASGPLDFQSAHPIPPTQRSFAGLTISHSHYIATGRVQDVTVVELRAWHILFLATLIPALALVLYLRRRPSPGHCPACGYDLRASPDRCPECGNQVRKTPEEFP
jgi:hypothetical protein